VTAGEVREVRTKLGLTQVQLASLLGVHPLTVSKWERGTLAPTPHDEALLCSFGTATVKEPEIGDTIATLLVTAGVALALYALLEAAFGKKR
jgi:transcriptional regulator with XRE-family HTH domain